MRLARIKPGDIVRVHDGLPYLAEVIGQHRARVRIAPITGPRGVRTVTSRDVVDHWRKTRSRQPSGGLAAEVIWTADDRSVVIVGRRGDRRLEESVE
jgi:hypothetical protein